MKDYIFNHGDEVLDTITGFSGIVTGRCDYMTGCNTYGVQPPVSEGKWVRSEWFDENRLELVEAGAKALEPQSTLMGG